MSKERLCCNCGDNIDNGSNICSSCLVKLLKNVDNAVGENHLALKKENAKLKLRVNTLESQLDAVNKENSDLQRYETKYEDKMKDLEKENELLRMKIAEYYQAVDKLIGRYSLES